MSPIRRTIFDQMRGNWNLDDSPAALWGDLVQAHALALDRNPFHYDPLRDLLRKHFDQDAVRGGDIQAFIAATNVQTAKVRIFERNEFSIEVLLGPRPALPNIHDAVMLDGVPYWDGGFRGNRRSGRSSMPARATTSCSSS